jgi:hypothetical protein
MPADADSLIAICNNIIALEKKRKEALQYLNSTRESLSNERWRDLSKLHRALLNEYDDLLLAANTSSSYSHHHFNQHVLTACRWKRTIFGFMEHLRRQLPGSLNHMLAFFDLAYTRTAALIQKSSSHGNIWTLFLGDLALYRTKRIESDQIWRNVASNWYAKVADRGQVQNLLYEGFEQLKASNQQTTGEEFACNDHAIGDADAPEEWVMV